MRFNKISAKGKVHSNTSLPQEQEKNQINCLTLYLKQLEKEEVKKPRVSRRKQIKIRAEINEKEAKETVAKINKTKSWFFEKMNKIDKPLTRHIRGKKGEESYQQNQKWKYRNNNRQHRNTQDHKRLLSAAI